MCEKNQLAYLVCMANNAEPHFLLLFKSICFVIELKIKLLRADNNSFIKCFYFILKTDADNFL